MLLYNGLRLSNLLPPYMRLCLMNKTILTVTTMGGNYEQGTPQIQTCCKTTVVFAPHCKPRNRAVTKPTLLRESSMTMHTLISLPQCV